MAGLKTLSDDAAAAADASGVSTSLDTSGAEVVDPATAELAAALARADQAETEYLVQSDRLAEVNAALAKSAGDLKEALEALDSANATKASLEQQLAALGAAPPPPPPEAKIKRPKAGTALKLPEEGRRAKADQVEAAYVAGELLVVVLADDKGVVQPYPAQIGGQGMFTRTAPGGLLFAPSIELLPELDRIEIRHAVLLDGTGKVLSSCRLSALLIGGGGLSALIPGNSLLFAFD